MTMISRAMSSDVPRGQGKFIRRFGHFGVGLINQIEVRAIVPIIQTDSRLSELPAIIPASFFASDIEMPRSRRPPEP